MSWPITCFQTLRNILKLHLFINLWPNDTIWHHRTLLSTIQTQQSNIVYLTTAWIYDVAYISWQGICDQRSSTSTARRIKPQIRVCSHTKWLKLGCEQSRHFMDIFKSIFQNVNPYILIQICGHHRGCLSNPIFSNLGLCAACWTHFMCHHELWPTSVRQSFSFSQ